MNLNTEHYDRRKLNPKKMLRANTAKPPRTRVGTDTSLPHNAYPGGKKLRKQMRKLAIRNSSGQKAGSMSK